MLFAKILRRNSHFLRSATGDVFVLLINRLLNQRQRRERNGKPIHELRTRNELSKIDVQHRAEIRLPGQHENQLPGFQRNRFPTWQSYLSMSFEHDDFESAI